MPTINYWYEGFCPQSGELLKLPRTHLVETIAGELMQHLASNELYSREGKMYGVLLGETKSGEQQVIKAFSGLLNGNSTVEGWVPPIPGRDRIVLNGACTLAKLEFMKQELIALQEIPAQQQYNLLVQKFERRSHELTLLHNQRKQDRQQQRQRLNLDDAALEQLNEQSRQDGIERKLFKRERDAVLQPLKAQILRSHSQSRELKQQRKTLSRQLQAQMHENLWLTNFAGESLPLTDLMPAGIRAGTGECCALKLLHHAATIGLKPLAIAEFWWGSSSSDKVQGQFYGACAERCQPLMGFLLSGLPSPPIVNDTPLTILYEDEWLIAVNKPPKLLSVPGRYSHRNDSVVGRLGIPTVHRLDYETSGILLLARDRLTHRHLSIQFQQRKVRKVYEAILAGVVNSESGTINLPLWGDPANRPYQKVDWQHGKPSLTQYKLLNTTNGYSRLEFLPLTGRSHQLRLHSVDKQGLGLPILGDLLYGCTEAKRLHLHAKELCFEHPQSKQTICLQTETPF